MPRPASFASVIRVAGDSTSVGGPIGRPFRDGFTHQLLLLLLLLGTHSSHQILPTMRPSRPR